MLSITVPAKEYWDELKNEFVTYSSEILLLEHSLVSLSKWEEITEKPFLGKEEKTREETLLYVSLMNSAPVSSPEVFNRLSQENFNDISAYIDRKMTATWFNEERTSPSREIITAEIIYYWMISLNVPFECQHWHINKLLTLIKTINLKNAPEKKQGKQSLAAQRRALNEARRKQHGTTG